MAKLWFKARKFGWGWTPASWEGWLVTAGFAVFLIIIGDLIGRTQDERNVGLLLFSVAFAVVALIKICYAYGERPRWSWGNN